MFVYVTPDHVLAVKMSVWARGNESSEALLGHEQPTVRGHHCYLTMSLWTEWMFEAVRDHSSVKVDWYVPSYTSMQSKECCWAMSDVHVVKTTHKPNLQAGKHMFEAESYESDSCHRMQS